MERLGIVVIPPLADAALQRISEVDSRIAIIDARGWFDGELRATWPRWTVDRYLGDRRSPSISAEQRDHALALADVALLGWPPLKDLRARAPRLKWVHQLPAGASNLLDTDLWASDILITTSRGMTNKRPMAEYVMAAFLLYSRALHLSFGDRARGRFDHRRYDPVVLRGKTACIVGAGGIGQEVADLCAAAGMRVVGTRRLVDPRAARPRAFARLESAPALLELLDESEYVAVCCPWTAESHHLIGEAAFAAMRPGTVLVNVSRGEIVDEQALLGALALGKLRGAALDVYDGEFDRPPDARLWKDERVLITPHVSAATDVSEHQGIALFCENLAQFLTGRPLKNVVDRARGY